MLLSDIKHQGYAQRLIHRALSGGRIHHAYVFHGPGGIGKESFAGALAQILLCPRAVDVSTRADDVEVIGTESQFVPCGRCEDCASTAAGTHPDWHLIYRQLNRDHPDAAVRKRKAFDLGVDVLRHFVIDRVGLTPKRGRYKVFIIREADRMTPQAQNALLKTLEEPPGDTVLILLAASLDRLLPTTLSRCQLAAFDTLPVPFVYSKLGEVLPDLSDDQKHWYARCSDGRVGMAMENARDDLYQVNQRLLDGWAQSPRIRWGELDKAWTQEAKQLGQRYRKRDPEVTDAEVTRRSFKTIFQLAAGWFAIVLRHHAGDGTSRTDPRWSTALDQAAKAISKTDALWAVERIAQAEYHLDNNVNTQLVLETLLNELAADTESCGR